MFYTNKKKEILYNILSYSCWSAALKSVHYTICVIFRTEDVHPVAVWQTAVSRHSKMLKYLSCNITRNVTFYLVDRS